MEMMGMSSRALSLATVLLLIGFGATDAALAQATNLEAGKAPSQLFTQTCTACHKSPRGLLKSVAPGSLPGFLRQHYTTSSDMAGVLASYLVSNGATDTRYQAKDGNKDGKDKKDGVKDKEANTNPAQPPEHRGRRQRSQESVRPEGEGAAPAAEGARQKRAARPAEEGAKEGVKPEGQAAPEGRKGKRRGKPGIEEAPKVDGASPAADDKKNEPKVESKPETAKDDSGESKSESSKPAEKPAEAKPAEVKPESAKVEPRGSDTPALQPDPVPQVTPAAPAAAKPAEPAAPKPAEEAAPKPAASSEPPAKSQEPAPPATAAAPPAAPAESSGAPTPPISR
jgi:hypothetical protein